jgi:hypothetical protein
MSVAVPPALTAIARLEAIATHELQILKLKATMLSMLKWRRGGRTAKSLTSPTDTESLSGSCAVYLTVVESARAAGDV